MPSMYDLIVIGAGPGGLMAAKIAGESGLKVALLERKSIPYELKRACSTMVISLSSYFLKERVQLNTRDGLLAFPVNGFSVRYGGPYKNFYSYHIYAPHGGCVALGDYQKKKGMGEKGRISATIDKPTLLQLLLEDVERNKVDVFTSQNAISVRKEKEKTKVVTHEGRVFEGTFVIAADGRNSRIARNLGLNRERIYYGTSSVRGNFISGVEFPQPEIVAKFFIGGERKIPMGCFFSPRAAGSEDEYFAVTSTLNINADHEEALNYLLCQSRFTSWFKKAKVGQTLCFTGNMYSPIVNPFRDNVLVIGDAAWSQEADVTGAILAGQKAASAVVVALMDGKLNGDGEGVRSYLDWWKDVYIQSIEHTHLIRNVTLPYVLSLDDIDYFFGLFQKPLPASLDPYEVPRLIAGEMKVIQPIIQRERPEILKKMEIFGTTPLEVLLAPHKRFGFPTSYFNP